MRERESEETPLPASVSGMVAHTLFCLSAFATCVAPWSLISHPARENARAVYDFFSHSARACAPKTLMPQFTRSTSTMLVFIFSTSAKCMAPVSANPPQISIEVTYGFRFSAMHSGRTSSSDILDIRSTWLLLVKLTCSFNEERRAPGGVGG